METVRQYPPVRSHRDLIVWQKAMDLCMDSYRLSASFPSQERFRLVDQLTRAAASVPANIAEGSARGSARDYARFLGIAKGSLMELQTFFDLAVRLNYVRSDDVTLGYTLIVEVSKMLTSLRRKLNVCASESSRSRSSQ